jgi:hypothetical protein
MIDGHCCQCASTQALASSTSQATEAKSGSYIVPAYDRRVTGKGMDDKTVTCGGINFDRE